MLLFGWLVVGWLLPTLLLLGTHPRAAARRRCTCERCRSRLARLEAAVLAGLQSLLDTSGGTRPPPRSARGASAAQPGGDPRRQRRGWQRVLARAHAAQPVQLLRLALRWLVLLVALWLPARTLAPLYTGTQ